MRIRKIFTVLLAFVLLTVTIYGASNVDFIMANWENYGANGNWHVTTIGSHYALGSTENTGWSGFWNKEAYQQEQRNYTFVFNMYNDNYGHDGDASSDDDNLGWTFRMTPDRGYVMVSDGGGASPSGLYKRNTGESWPGTMLVPIPELNRNSDIDWPMKIVVEGDNFKIYKYGSLICDYTDTTDPIPYGGYGPFTSSQAYGYFYQVELNGIGLANKPCSLSISSPTGTTELYEGMPIPITVSLKDREGDDVSLVYTLEQPGKTPIVVEDSERIALGPESQRNHTKLIDFGNIQTGNYKLSVQTKEYTSEGTGLTTKKIINIFISESPLKIVYDTITDKMSSGDNRQQVVVVGIDKPITRNAVNDMYLDRIKDFLEKNNGYVYFINYGNFNMAYLKEKLTRFFIIN